jgi:hypothetical protein
MMPEDPDPIREEGRGDRLAFAGRERLPSPKNCEFKAARDGQDGVLVDAMHARSISFE